MNLLQSGPIMLNDELDDEDLRELTGLPASAFAACVDDDADDCAPPIVPPPPPPRARGGGPRVVCLSVAAVGHITPMIALARALVARGCAVRFYAHGAFRAAVEAAGAAFCAYEGVGDVAAVNPGKGGPLCLQPAAVALLPGLLAAARAWAPACVVHDLFAVWGLYLGAILELPTVCAIASLYDDDELEASGAAPSAANAAALAALRETYGVVATWQDAVRSYSDAGANVVFTTPELQPHAAARAAARAAADADAAARAPFRFVGPPSAADLADRALDAGDAAVDAADAAFVARVAAAKRALGGDDGVARIVYVSMGTELQPPPKFWRVVRRALAVAPWLLVCAVGDAPGAGAALDDGDGGDDGDARPPSRVLYAARAPQRAVLALADAFVTHCGINSTHEALAAGVPLVALPHRGDQPQIADAVAGLGAGVALDASFGAPRCDDLRAAVARVLDEPGFAEAARALGERLARADGAAVAAEIVMRAAEQGRAGVEVETSAAETEAEAEPGVSEACNDAGDDASATSEDDGAAELSADERAALLEVRDPAAGDDVAGLAVFSLVPEETRFVHWEIFARRCYALDGFVALRDGATVVDAGAHVGLFALWCAHECALEAIHCFEPMPAQFGALRANCRLHGLSPGVARLRRVALGAAPGAAEFTYYPRMPSNSTRAPREKRALQAGVMRAARFERARAVRCEVVRLGDALRGARVEAVDLLKVDVEGEELNVLRGLDDEGWALVRQVVLEVHDVDGRVGAVEALLASRGFETRIEDDDALGLKAARCVVVAGRRPGERAESSGA